MTSEYSSFTIRCPYCGGTHVAALVIPPYGGEANAYGVFYGVECAPTDTRFGVHASTDLREV